MTPELIRLGPPSRVKLRAAPLKDPGTIGSERTTSTLSTGVFRSAGSPAPTLTTTGTSMPVAHEVESVPEPASPKKSVVPVALTVRV